MKISAMGRVISEVIEERERQNKKWGQQDHTPVEWCAILGEEYGEVCKAALEAHFEHKDPVKSIAEYRMELIQVAAVAIQMVECLDRDADFYE